MTKRLLMLGALGGHLEGHDGHIWICSDEEDEFCENRIGYILRRGGVLLNNKIYGGALEALNMIDIALEKAGSRSLLEWWDDEWMFLGEDTTHDNRIDLVKPGEGGMY